METIPQHHKDLFLVEPIIQIRLELSNLAFSNQKRALSHLKVNRTDNLEVQPNLHLLEGYLVE